MKEDRNDVSIRGQEFCHVSEPDVCSESLNTADYWEAVGNIRNFLIIRSKQEDDAVVRLQSNPLMFGLAKLSGVTVSLYDPRSSTDLTIDCPTCIIFHYNDRNAVAALRTLLRPPYPTRVICLGSDLYTFTKYTDLHDLVDLYIMPTAEHCRVLSSQVGKPVYLLPECVDPVVLIEGDAALGGENEARDSFPTRYERRTCWFGYAESFDKGMSSLMTVIQEALKDGKIECFDVIVNEMQFINNFGLSTIPYDNTTFRNDLSRFDYVILSHFSLDLTINSYIKSPNKAISSLFSGAIPIASDTPNYREFFQTYGLDKFLFGSPLELDLILRNLDPVADSRIIQNADVVRRLRVDKSQDRLCTQFLDILKRHQARDDRWATLLAPREMPPPEKLITFGDHLSDLAPSFMRGMRARARRWWK